MEIGLEIALPGQTAADVVALLVTDPPAPLGEGARIVDGKLGGRIGRLAEAGDLPSAVGETRTLDADGSLSARRVVVAGVGPRESVDADSLRTPAAAGARDFGSAVVWLLDESLPLPVEEQARALVEGTVLGAYDPGRWKTQERTRPQLERIVIGHFDSEPLRAAAERALLVSQRANRARDLANAPPNELTPAALAEHAEQLADEHAQLTCEILGPAEIDALGMGSFAAVGRSSVNEARLIVLRYDATQPRGDIVLGLVGKAITFDSGGLSIKPPASMEDMKGDMAGGAGVIEGIGAIAALNLPVRTLAVVAS